jgi:hypothetical protein
LLVHRLVASLDSARHGLRREVDRLAEREPFAMVGQVAQDALAGLAQRLDGEIAAGPGEVQGGAGRAEAQRPRVGQILPRLQQTAVLRSPVVGQFRKELQWVGHVDPPDDRDDLPRLGVLYDLSIVFHILLPNPQPCIAPIRKAACRFRQAASLIRFVSGISWGKTIARLPELSRRPPPTKITQAVAIHLPHKFPLNRRQSSLSTTNSEDFSPRSLRGPEGQLQVWSFRRQVIDSYLQT